MDWINQLPDPLENLTLEDLADDCTTFLIPQYDREQEARQFIKRIYETIFVIELHSWITDPAYWPVRRSYEMFLEWFDVELHSEVIDTQKGKIEKEDY